MDLPAPAPEQIFSLTEAWEYLKSKGYEAEKNSFRKQFSKHPDNPDYTFRGFKRLQNPNGKGYLYRYIG